jgi:hypothetical protein
MAAASIPKSSVVGVILVCPKFHLIGTHGILRDNCISLRGVELSLF